MNSAAVPLLLLMPLLAMMTVVPSFILEINGSPSTWPMSAGAALPVLSQSTFEAVGGRAGDVQAVHAFAATAQCADQVVDARGARQRGHDHRAVDEPVVHVLPGSLSAPGPWSRRTESRGDVGELFPPSSPRSGRMQHAVVGAHGLLLSVE